MTTQFYTVRGAASHVHVNQSLTLLRRGTSDGSLRPAPGLVQLPGLRYEAPDRGLGWDGARDLRSPEPLLSLAISPPEDQAALQSSVVKLVRAAVKSQGLSVNGVSALMCKMSAKLQNDNTRIILTKIISETLPMYGLQRLEVPVSGSVLAGLHEAGAGRVVAGLAGLGTDTLASTHTQLRGEGEVGTLTLRDIQLTLLCRPPWPCSRSWWR